MLYSLRAAEDFDLYVSISVLRVSIRDTRQLLESILDKYSDIYLILRWWLRYISLLLDNYYNYNSVK